MTKCSDSQQFPADPVDVLIGNLLDCADVLRRIVDHMQRFSEAGLSAPDTPPIEEVIREIVTGVVAPVAEKRAPAELELASAVVDELTKAICEEIHLVPVDGTEP
jgi:hypothetical protein